MGIDIERGEIDDNTETASWCVTFYGTKDAKEMEDLLMAKEDWATIKLANHSGKLPAWAGRGNIPDGSKTTIPDYRKLQVNISGARIMRIPHGVGTILTIKSDTDTKPSLTNDFYLYYGSYIFIRVQKSSFLIYCNYFI